MMIHKRIFRKFESYLSHIATVSVGDIVLPNRVGNGIISHNQFLVASRYLDVKRYYNKQKMKYHIIVGKAGFGKRFDEDSAIENFINLIKSYEINGYNIKSFVDVDSKLQLYNGSHRIGINIFLNENIISVRSIPRKLSIPSYLDWNVLHPIPQDIVDDIIEGYNEICEKVINNGHTFVAIFDSKSYIEQLATCSDVSIIRTMEYNNDNINLFGLPFPTKVVLVQFTVLNPDYYYRKGLFVSKRIDEIKKTIKTNSFCYFSNSCLEGYRILKYFQMQSTGVFDENKKVQFDKI